MPLAIIRRPRRASGVHNLSTIGQGTEAKTSGVTVSRADQQTRAAKEPGTGRKEIALFEHTRPGKAWSRATTGVGRGPDGLIHHCIASSNHLFSDAKSIGKLIMIEAAPSSCQDRQLGS